MDGLITQVSVGGMFALYVLKSVFEFLDKKRMNGYSPVETAKKVDIVKSDLHDMCKSMGDLIEIHKGADNKKIGEQISDIWYDRKALARTTEKLYSAVDNLTLSINKNNEITMKVYNAFEKASKK